MNRALSRKALSRLIVGLGLWMCVSASQAETNAEYEASLKTQREMQEYWKRQREGKKEIEASRNKPAEAAEEKKEKKGFSWWRRSEKKEQAAPKPAPEKAPEPKPQAAEEPKKKRGFSWWGGNKKEQAVEAQQQAQAQSQPRSGMSDEEKSRATQREFQEHWARQKAIKESRAVPEPQPVQEEQPEKKNGFRWWGSRDDEPQAAEPTEAPVPQKVEQAPVNEPVQDQPKERRTLVQWLSDRNKGNSEEVAQTTETAPEPVQDEQGTKAKRATWNPAKWWSGDKKEQAAQQTVEIDLSGDFPKAIRVPNREDLVYSPYNGKKVKVKGAKSGDVIADPRYDISERKFFIVP